MRITILVRFFFLLVSVLILTAAAPAMGAAPGPDNTSESEPETCRLYDVDVEAFIPIADCTETRVTGNSEGNHELNFTVIRPWGLESKKGHKIPKNGYPVIVWANGWGWNNVAGETTTIGYKPGLIEWAISGPYIVVAANAWSAQESDVLRCLQWIVDQDDVQGSDYFGKINRNKIGLAGHSQGGGATIKAGGDGEQAGVVITAIIAMNPYGPAWVDSGNQDGPMLILGGKNDTTTPPGSYQAVWDAVKVNGIGGINAVLLKGTHNSEAWGVDPYPDGETLDNEEASKINFVKYQYITELWWDYFLNNNSRSLVDLIKEFDDEWEIDDACDWLLP
jgi:hypothetical protein